MEILSGYNFITYFCSINNQNQIGMPEILRIFGGYFGSSMTEEEE